ncbi:hypothetical protein [Clostridium sp.]|uniref:hypothetical protein n=1 Tax=Clostridium sp. TaxID=1506 RepID=UPI0025C59CC4|nr:hypothetical protein [Clostridium sp.]
MKKVSAKIDNNGYVECGNCGCSTVVYDKNGKVRLSNNFVTTKDGFGLNFPSVRSVYSEELGRELTELTIVCKKCNTENVYLVDISDNNKRYAEIGNIKAIEDGEL